MMEALDKSGNSPAVGSADEMVHLPSMADVLRRRAQEQPDETAYIFLPEMGNEVSLTYGELDRRARSLAAWLQNQAEPGERVLLLYPPGLEFVVGFFACFYASMIAVPLKTPRKNRSLERLYPVIRDANARFAFTDEVTLRGLGHHADAVPGLTSMEWVATDGLDFGAEHWIDPQVQPGDIAFLQYTSGSTSDPKGVIVTHGNLMHNEAAVRVAYGHDHNSTFVGWLPVFHDMGLVGNLLQPLYIGARCYFMAPATFVGSPFRWLKAISDYRAHTAGGPNFAYEHCCNKITAEQKAQLDLSSWQVAFNGAEPVSASTLARFTAEFQGCGFSPRSHYPCYGMAEATLFITGGQKQAGATILPVSKAGFKEKQVVAGCDGDGSVYKLVGCGRPWLDMEVQIVDPQTCQPLNDPEIGEIWVRGGSVAAGYWNQPEMTRESFQASIDGDGTGARYLRTGDLGFLRDGELYITGRLKDLIIIRGRNYYPHDIEAVVNRVCPEAFEPGYGAAFSTPAVCGEEQLIVAYEVKRDYRNAPLDDIAERTVRAIQDEFGLGVRALCILKPASLMKTSSGKVQRQAMRKAYLDGRLECIFTWEPMARSQR